MPSATTHGYPFPVGTDRVMDGDNAMQSLAQYTDDNLWGATAQKFPRVRIDYPGAGTSVLNSTLTLLAMTGGTVAYDTNGMADIANNRIVIKTAGFYVVTVRCVFNNTSPGTGFRAILAQINGASPYAVDFYTLAAGTTSTILMASSAPWQFAANDNVRVMVNQSNGAALLCGLSVNGVASYLAATWCVGQ